MLDELFLRPTVIGGETADDDYQVILSGMPIGRIFRTVGAPDGKRPWSWGVILSNLPQRAHWRGRTEELEEAKGFFKAAWSDARAQLRDEDLAEARRRREDRNRPWHRQ